MEDLTDALAPVLEAAGLELVDVETGPGLLRVIVDRPGGVDLEALAEANRLASTTLDELDPFPARYTLEVTSPGLERALRRPEHFVRAVGTTVNVRTAAPVDGARRMTGTLVAADADGFSIEGPEVPGGSRHLTYADVDRARTVFSWGPDAQPRRGKRSPSAGGAKGGRATRSNAPATAGTPPAAPGRAQGHEVKMP